jgi:hypothetical protein
VIEMLTELKMKNDSLRGNKTSSKQYHTGLEELTSVRLLVLIIRLDEGLCVYVVEVFAHHLLQASAFEALLARFPVDVPAL